MIPSVAEIAEAPERAILAALDATLWLAQHALLAEHPELSDPDPPRPPEPLTRCANSLLIRAHKLRDSLRQYLNALANMLECDPNSDPNDDLPF